MASHYRTNEQIVEDAKVYCASRNSLFKKNGISVYLYQELLFSKYDVETKRALLEIYKEKIKLKMYVDNYGWNIGMYAIYYEKMEIFKDIVRALPFIMLQLTTEQFEQFPKGSSMLDVAAQIGNMNAVFTLLKAGIGFDIEKFTIDFRHLKDCQISKEYVESYSLLSDLLVVGDVIKQPSYNTSAPYPALVKAIEAKDKSDKAHKNSTNDESTSILAKIQALSAKARRCDNLLDKTSFERLSLIFNLSLTDYQAIKYNSFNFQMKAFTFLISPFRETQIINHYVNVPFLDANGVYYQAGQIIDMYLRGQHPYVTVLRDDGKTAKFHPATIRLNNSVFLKKQVKHAQPDNAAVANRQVPILSKPPGLHSLQSDASK